MHQERGQAEPSHEGVIASSMAATFRLVWLGAVSLSPSVQLDLFPLPAAHLLSSFPLPPLLVLLSRLLTDDQVDVVREPAVLARLTVAVVGVAGTDLRLL